jgi:transposase InsO family protein
MTDPFFPVGNGEALARDIPGARLLVLERAATAIPDVAAGEVAAAMLERRRACAARPPRRQRAAGTAQFVSLAFGQKARDAGIAVSMGSKGCAYDNAVAESFFATIKKQLAHPRSWPTRRELISEVFDFVEGFYNTTRRHSTLGYLSPAQFETMREITINKENG